MTVRDCVNHVERPRRIGSGYFTELKIQTLTHDTRRSRSMSERDSPHNQSQLQFYVYVAGGEIEYWTTQII